MCKPEQNYTRCHSERIVSEYRAIARSIRLIGIPPDDPNMRPSAVAMVKLFKEYFSTSAFKLSVVSLRVLVRSISFGFGASAVRASGVEVTMGWIAGVGLDSGW